MTSTQLYLIRHAESEGNAHFEKGLGRLPYTELGSDLTERGIAQAGELAQELTEANLAAIYSSHLRRAHHTAEILGKNHGNNILLMPELREREEGKEADDDATSRFVDMVNHLVAKHPGQAIAVVTHGFVIRVFLGHIGIKNLDEMASGYVQNTGYLRFDITDGEYKLVETRRVG